MFSDAAGDAVASEELLVGKREEIKRMILNSIWLIY